MNATSSTRWLLIAGALVLAVLSTGCGRLRGDRDAGSEPAATFTAVAPAATTAPVVSEPTAMVEAATALPEPTATQPAQPTVAPTTVPPTAAPTATVVKGDEAGAALEDFLGGLGNNAADDSAILTELDQIP